MEQVLMQLMPVAQQYMQSQSPQAAAELLQMIAQSGDQQLTMMIADQISQLIMQSSQEPSMGTATDQNTSMTASTPMGANGMKVPLYQNGGKMSTETKKMSAVEKLAAKKKKGGKMC